MIHLSMRLSEMSAFVAARSALRRGLWCAELLVYG
jgi:hypothetical protein